MHIVTLCGRGELDADTVGRDDEGAGVCQDARFQISLQPHHYFTTSTPGIRLLEPICLAIRYPIPA